MIKIGVVSKGFQQAHPPPFLRGLKKFSTQPVSSNDFVNIHGQRPRIEGDPDLLFIHDNNGLSSEVAAAAVKSNLPVFLYSTDGLSYRDIHDLSKLSAEAGTRTICFNPYIHNRVFPDINKFIDHPYFCEFTLNLVTNEDQDIHKHLFFLVELCLLVTRGNYLRSVAKSYSEQTGLKDLILVQLDFDSGSRTEIKIHQNSWMDSTFHFNQSGKALVWYPGKNYLETFHRGIRGWQKKIKEYAEKDTGDSSPAENILSELVRGRPTEPNLETRAQTSRIVMDLDEILNPAPNSPSFT